MLTDIQTVIVPERRVEALWDELQPSRVLRSTP
jgi:hypothetical protein